MLDLFIAYVRGEGISDTQVSDEQCKLYFENAYQMNKIGLKYFSPVEQQRLLNYFGVHDMIMNESSLEQLRKDYNVGIEGVINSTSGGNVSTTYTQASRLGDITILESETTSTPYGRRWLSLKNQLRGMFV